MRYVVLLLLTTLLAAGAHAEPDDAEATVKKLLAPDPAADAPAGEIGFRLVAPNRLELHARGLDVATAFAQLRHLLRRNIVVAPDVQARFTGDLYDVTLEQALDVICASTGLVARERGSLIFIARATPETRLFKLSYARAADLAALLEPMLGPEGRITATKAAETGLRTDQENVGGDAYASPDALLVRELPDRLEQIARAIDALDVRPRQVLLEATILAAEVDDDRALGVEFTALAGTDFRATGSTSTGGTSVTLGDLPPEQLDESTGSAATGFLSELPSDGLTIGLLKNSLGVFVRALDEITDITVLANPKVLALNKQRGEVIVGRRDGYLTTTVTETSTVQTVEFLDTGTRLVFRPFIGEDGHVRLEIHPEDSSGGVTSDGLPFKNTAEVTTNILVKSGRTIVIGGLFRERAVSTIRKVPGLGDIPVAGAAFRSKQTEVKREEILILLTPRILAPPARRGGKRADFAAERLARAYLAQAQAALATGDRERAARLATAAERLRPGLAGLRALGRRLEPPAATDVEVTVRERVLAKTKSPKEPQ